jgi:hypothetical protein
MCLVRDTLTKLERPNRLFLSSFGFVKNKGYGAFDMINVNDQKNPYRLQARNKDDEPWRNVLTFGMDNLESYWGIAKEMNGVKKHLLVQIVSNQAASQRAKPETDIQAHRARVLKAVMRNVPQIVNNALNEFQVFRLDAEALLPEESLISFDDLIQRTATQLKLAIVDLVKVSLTEPQNAHTRAA